MSSEPARDPTVPQTMSERIAELNQRRRKAMEGGGASRLDKHRGEGKLTARERVEALLDPDSFQEMFLFARHRGTFFGMAEKELPADGVVTGYGAVAQRLVHVASQDFTVAGGSAGEVHCDKIVEVMKDSLKTGSPFIFFNDSGGARVQEGIDSLAGYGRIFYHNVLLSGVVPQIALICGPCAGGAAYSPALTDFTIQTRKAQMFLTGPQVIKATTGEVVTAEELGGAVTQMNYSGVTHFVAEDDRHAVAIARDLLSYLPSNNAEDPPRRPHDGRVEPDPTLADLVPVNPRQSYDMRTVIKRLVDFGTFLEVHESYAANMIVGFARIVGRPVGIIANQPAVMGGVLDIDSSDKAARFVRFCNAFNMPVVNLVDVPGFLPGIRQEYGGIIRHGAKMLFAYSAATVPKVSVILRKAYGGAYLAMCAKELGADRVAAWPTAEIAVMGAEGAVNVVFRREIESSENPEAKRAELIETYRSNFSSPFVAASRRLVDDIIDPAQTRRYLAVSLEALRNKRDHRPEKKHGLIPL